MTEPTNEQIERAAKAARWNSGGAPIVEDVKDAASTLIDGIESGFARSILAHARTIAEAEAREARLREALERIAGHDTERTREDCRYIAKDALLGGIEDVWRPMDEWDGRSELVFLLVDYENGDHPLEDCKVGFTIGHCAPDSETGWQFAGWCWSHDHYTEGRGEPIAWLPVPAGMLFRQRTALQENPDG